MQISLRMNHSPFCKPIWMIHWKKKKKLISINVFKEIYKTGCQPNVKQTCKTQQHWPSVTIMLCSLADRGSRCYWWRCINGKRYTCAQKRSICYLLPPPEESREVWKLLDLNFIMLFSHQVWSQLSLSDAHCHIHVRTPSLVYALSWGTPGQWATCAHQIFRGLEFVSISVKCTCPCVSPYLAAQLMEYKMTKKGQLI